MAMGGAAFSYTKQPGDSIAGTFGAAAAASSAAGLDAREMRFALNYPAQQSSGIIAWRRDSDHIEKAFVFAGMPARNGATAALVVRSGWNGVDDIFSGSHNFLHGLRSKRAAGTSRRKTRRALRDRRDRHQELTVGSPIRRRSTRSRR